MILETPSVGDATVQAEASEKAVREAVAAAETVLAQRFGSAITLVEPTLLTGSGPATVVRARVSASPFALPRTLVIKHFADAPEPGTSDAFAQEAASYQLFTALSASERVCPELLAHNGKLRVLVIDDLGRAPTLYNKLFAQDAKAAERALLSWARSLGKLHATTASRETDFNTLLRRLGDSLKPSEPEYLTACVELPTLLWEVCGIETSEEVQNWVKRAAERVRDGAYRAFSPVDLSPDNNLVTSSGVRFLDFEFGQVRNVLIDVAHLRVPFISGENAMALPSGMCEAMLAAWRAELSTTWPALMPEQVFAARLVESQLTQVWHATWRSLPSLTQASPNGQSADATTINSPAALVHWWNALSVELDTVDGDHQHVSSHARLVANTLAKKLGVTTDLPLYPAFRA